jgi:hypothetical protein
VSPRRRFKKKKDLNDVGNFSGRRRSHGSALLIRCRLAEFESRERKKEERKTIGNDSSLFDPTIDPRLSGVKTLRPIVLRPNRLTPVTLLREKNDRVQKKKKNSI